MRPESDPRNLETYLEAPGAYDGGLDPAVEHLADALRQWPHEAALQPRPGFLNELSQKLDAQERAPSPAVRPPWFRLGDRLLRGAGAALLAAAILALFAFWLASLSPQGSAPAASSPAAPPVPFLAPGTSPESVRTDTHPGLAPALRTALGMALEFAGALLPWLLLAAALLCLLAWFLRRRWTGKVAAVAGLLLLFLALAGYSANDISWRLFPALVRGYHYDPNVEEPDSRLLPERPEVLVARQLDALLGRTGRPPLDPTSPLSGYAIHSVRLVPGDEPLLIRLLNPGERRWHAEVTLTLEFAGGFTRPVTLGLTAGAGPLMHVPLLGAFTYAPFAWRDSELTFMGDRFQGSAPITSVQQANPPLALAPVAEIDAANLPASVNPQTTFVAASDISRSGDVLADVDLREGERHLGNGLLFHPAGGDTHLLATTRWSARATFSPDGRRIAYVRGPGEYGLRLFVREADGSERQIAWVDSRAHHWVGNNHLAFRRNNTAYLYDLRDGTAEALVLLVSADLTAADHFRVSPDARRIAYVDLEGRLWVEEIESGQRQQLGWDVYELGWGSGMAWRPDGRQLAYTTMNDVTLPGQAELWLWDAATGETTLLARAGKRFLGSAENVRLGKACWVDADTVLFVADLSPLPDVRLLAARTDGSGVWNVTPDGVTIPFPESACANRYLVVNRSRTALALYQIQR